jgi:cytochrome c biogenesis protein CcdA
MLARLGTAFLFVGVIVLVVFVITFSADQADLRTLLAGAGLAILGLVLRRRGAPAEAESSRFVTMRKVLRRREPPPQDGPEDV